MKVNFTKKNRLLYSIVLLIVMLSLGGLIYANRSFLQIGSPNERQTIFSFESGQQFQFEKAKDNVLVISNDGIICVNQSGTHLWNIINHLTTPCVQSEGAYTLIFDRGGKVLTTYNGNAKIAEIITDQKIITAKINAAGYIALVSNEVGYKAKIEVYNQHGEVVYKWMLGESHPVDVDISPDCKQLVAATLCTNSGKISGTITFVDIDKEKVINETKRDDSLLISVRYSKNGSLIALGESELLGFNKKGENKWNVNLDGRTLQSFDLSNDNNIVLALTGSRNNTIVDIYDQNGKQRGEYVSDFQIKSLDVNEGTIAISQQRDIKLLNFNGKVKSQKTVQKDIHDIILLPQDKVAVIGGNTVDIVKP